VFAEHGIDRVIDRNDAELRVLPFDAGETALQEKVIENCCDFSLRNTEHLS
jgi:hypothetical protein